MPDIEITAEQKQEITNLITAASSNNYEEAIVAQQEIAAAISTPVRQGVLHGNTIADIFNEAEDTEYPVDLYRADNAGEFVAYTIPDQGLIPQRHVEGDYVRVPTYQIGSAVDTNLRYVRKANWDVIARMMSVLEAGATKKMNDDGWHTLIYAGNDRGIMVYDANATAGQFTKRLISLMKLIMRRNAGGNSASINRGRLTDLYVSPEAIEDIRNWGVDQVDEITRREIYTADEGTVNRIFGVNLNDLDELGESQEYQTYFATTLSGTMGTSDKEIVVGVDKQNNDSFVMPVEEQFMVYPDPSLHRQGKIGFYGRGDMGFGVLTGARILLGSF